MSVTAARRKTFIQELLKHKELTLSDALGLLFDGTIKAEEADVVLRGLSFGEFFKVYQKGKALPGFRMTAAVLDAIDQYSIRLHSIVGADDHNSKIWQLDIDPSQVSSAGPFKFFASLKRTDYFSVVGNVEDAATMHERVRAFTQYFAFNFTSRRFDVIAGLFSKTVNDRFTEQAILQIVEEQEAEWGRFEFFDQVKVLEVYAGKDSAKKVFDPMRIPKGMAASARRGMAGFHLVSAATPNGVAIFSCAVILSIIEEDDVFRVCNMEWREAI